MNKIIREFNIPGSTTCAVIIPRKTLGTTSNKKITLQLALPVLDDEYKSTK